MKLFHHQRDWNVLTERVMQMDHVPGTSYGCQEEELEAATFCWGSVEGLVYMVYRNPKYQIHVLEVNLGSAETFLPP